MRHPFTNKLQPKQGKQTTQKPRRDYVTDTDVVVDRIKTEYCQTQKDSSPVRFKANTSICSDKAGQY